MVEAVLVVPVMMVLLLAMIQFALWAHSAQVVQLAASEGDRAARTMGGGVSAGRARADAVLSGLDRDVGDDRSGAAVRQNRPRSPSPAGPSPCFPG